MKKKQAQNLRESLFVINQFASEYFQDVLYNQIDGQRIGMTYLRRRGLRDNIIKKFQLGYSTDNSDALLNSFFVDDDFLNIPSDVFPLKKYNGI